MATDIRGDWLAACDLGGLVKLFRRYGDGWMEHGNALGKELGIALSPEGERVATSIASGETLLWDTQEIRLLSTLPAGSSQGWAVEFSTEKKWIATADFEGTLRTRDAKSYSPIELQREDGPVTALAFSGDSRWLVSVPDRRVGQVEPRFGDCRA